MAGLFAGMAVHAQTAMAADEIAVPPYVESYSEETYVEPPPPVVYREEETYVVPARRPPPPVDVVVLPPREVFAVVRERGFEPMGPARRRGWVYSVSAIDPNGENGRVVVDARTGRVMRFVPAYAMTPRMGHEIAVRYGRFGQTIEEPRYAPRPPAGVPHSSLHGVTPKFADRTPSSVPLPRPRHATKTAAKPAAVKPVVAKAADKPAVDTTTPAAEKAAVTAATDRASATSAAETSAESASATVKDSGAKNKEAKNKEVATQVSAAAESKTIGAAQSSMTAADAKPVETKTATAKPAEIELKPTQDMPPVQPLN
ncbi:hypothetical protein ACSVBT_03460 [Afipia sp. TerB]